MTIAKYLAIRYPDICLSLSDIEYLMWNETAYPFAGLKTQIRQIGSAVRAHRRGVSRCFCGQPEEFCRCRTLLSRGRR